MAERRGRGEDAVYFDHVKGSACRDEKYHRSCSGRWIGLISLGVNGEGRRVRKKVVAKTKTEVYARLTKLHQEMDQGVKSSSTYKNNDACEDWLETLTDRAPKTISTKREMLAPLRAVIGKTLLRDLEADDVTRGLKRIAATRSTRTVRDTRAVLVRVITYAQARNLVGRNVASLISAPPGKAPGRPSRALTAEQGMAVLKEAKDDRLYSYFVLSLLLGVRTEEARALRWDHVDLDGDPDADPPVPSHVDVFRSVRVHGDTKTAKSRRTLMLPKMAVDALRARQEAQAKEKAEMESVGMWEETGLVFTTWSGRALDAHNVRRSFRRICEAAGIGEDWTTRDLRHSFVSIMSESGVPVEEIARLIGHTGGSQVTERIYRKELRPVITTGAEVMDKILAPKPKRRVVRRRPRPS